jgi:hypothetical protein
VGWALQNLDQGILNEFLCLDQDSAMPNPVFAPISINAKLLPIDDFEFGEPSLKKIHFSRPHLPLNLMISNKNLSLGHSRKKSLSPSAQFLFDSSYTFPLIAWPRTLGL